MFRRDIAAPTVRNNERNINLLRVLEKRAPLTRNEVELGDCARRINVVSCIVLLRWDECF
jgi:hypothetical protein